MIYKTVEPCKKKKGFEGFPDEFYNISLMKLLDILSKKLPNYEPLRETKIMIMLVDNSKNYKISIFPSGRVFIHGTLSKDEANEILGIISESILELVHIE